MPSDERGNGQECVQYREGTPDRVKVRFPNSSCECWSNYSPRIWGSRAAARKQIQEADTCAGLREHLDARSRNPGDIA